MYAANDPGLTARQSHLTKPRVRDGILFLTLIACWLLPAIYLASIEYVDPFFWTPLSAVDAGLRSEQLRVGEPEHASYEILLFGLASATGLDAAQMAILPIGSVAVPMLYFAIALLLTNSRALSAILASALSLDFSAFPTHYSTFAYVWTYVFFLTFLLVMVLRSTGAVSWQFPLLVFVLFVPTYYLHPTYTMWILLSVVGLAGGAKLLHRFRGISRGVQAGAAALAAALIAFYFGFNQFFYNTFLRRIILTEPEAIVEEFSTSILSFIGLVPSQLDPMGVGAVAPSATIAIVATVRVAVVLGATFAGLVFLVKYWPTATQGLRVRKLIVVGVLMGVGAAHTIGYAIYGHMSLRFLTVMYPVLAAALLVYADQRRIALLFALVLLVLASVGTLSYVVATRGESDSPRLAEVQGAGEFLLREDEQGQVSYLSDFHTSQLVRYQMHDHRENVSRVYFSSPTYLKLVGEDAEGAADFTHLVLSKKTQQKPLSSIGWQQFEPYALHLPEIEANPSVSRVFENDHVIIYRYS